MTEQFDLVDKLASELVKGDMLSCDLGYGARSDDQCCEVLSAKLGEGLFGDPEIQVQVKLPDGTVMNHVGIVPTHTVLVGINQRWS